MNKGFWFAIDNLSSFAKSFLVVYALGFLSSPFLINIGFHLIPVTLFSISLLLVWSDGFLTLYALNKGGTEINPAMSFLNKKLGKKMGFLISRIGGSALLVLGLLTENLYFLLLLAWLFSGVVCLSAVQLVEHLHENPDVKGVENDHPKVLILRRTWSHNLTCNRD